MQDNRPSSPFGDPWERTAVALLCCARVTSSTCEIEIERAVLHAIEGGV